MAANQLVETRSQAVSVIGLSRVLELAVNRTGLTGSQFRALAMVRAGITSGGVIARFLDVRPPTVTTVMNGLVDDGLVRRARADDDRRRVEFELTDAGTAALDTADAAADRALESLAGELPAADRASAAHGLDLWRAALDSRMNSRMSSR